MYVYIIYYICYSTTYNLNNVMCDVWAFEVWYDVYDGTFSLFFNTLFMYCPLFPGILFYHCPASQPPISKLVLPFWMDDSKPWLIKNSGGSLKNQHTKHGKSDFQGMAILPRPPKWDQNGFSFYQGTPPPHSTRPPRRRASWKNFNIVNFHMSGPTRGGRHKLNQQSENKQKYCTIKNWSDVINGK